MKYKFHSIKIGIVFYLKFIYIKKFQDPLII